jgi:riboflavin synthase
MFTGIIEDIGTITKIVRSRVQLISIASRLAVKQGDSVAIQGICLTVTSTETDAFRVESMKQTKRVTTLSDWNTGDKVNLERSLMFDGRLGGHIVLGHVDEVVKCIRRRANEYTFQASSQNARYLVPKGSICINGVSLTIGNASGSIFTLSLIPYTLEHTTLGDLLPGAFVNIEYDYLAKLVMHRV